MKKGFDFISVNQGDFTALQALEIKTAFQFPVNFNKFVNDYSFSSDSIVIETTFDELRGFYFPAEAALFKPSSHSENPIYLNDFRDLEDIEEDLKYLLDDSIWQEKGLIVIGYTTDDEKICLGCKENINDQIWLVREDAMPENKYTHLADNIFTFVRGLHSVC